MPETSTGHAEVHGVVNGAVVQAGSIGHVTLAVGDGRRLPVPRQLPAAVGDFTGRAEHVAALDAPAARVADNGPSAVAVVAGAAGVGKTASALHWSHRVQERFPHGTLHADLRGYGPGEPATPAEVLFRFLRALGVGPKAVPPGVEEQAALYRSLLAGSRVLVVLDNARAAEQVRPLLPGAPGCLVVVTSRAALSELISQAAMPVKLAVMPGTESVELLRRIIGPRRAGVEEDDVVRLAGVCGGLPPALSRGTDNGRQEAFVRTNRSRALAGLGRYDEALAHAERALVLRRRSDDREGEVFTLDQLARVRQALGDHGKAIALCEQAIAIRPEHAYRPDLAAAFDTLGASAPHVGDSERATSCRHRALEVLDDFGDHRAAALRARLGAAGDPPSGRLLP
ncbi:tetratricopeptide repeat protein [Saccharothrix texasensis]|uniref:Tetratricopeptide repeat protein n=1 Tax=Saccharothrix texasensis TaxID=103734 RepID=A0A3N1H3I1_9PSEU|nr:tetratricopeptide repeat protein [Saccharothrix texasensis]ROP37074.1 tetratricopeptide repeat protein [Saccharothrix texasensis]